MLWAGVGEALLPEPHSPSQKASCTGGTLWAGSSAWTQQLGCLQERHSQDRALPCLARGRCRGRGRPLGWGGAYGISLEEEGSCVLWPQPCLLSFSATPASLFLGPDESHRYGESRCCQGPSPSPFPLVCATTIPAPSAAGQAQSNLPGHTARGQLRRNDPWGVLAGLVL